MKVTKEATPALVAFCEQAAGYKAGEWGDGAILDMIKQLLEQMMPFILECFAMKTKDGFVSTCHCPTGPQRMRLHIHARSLARKIDGLKISDRLEVARAAVDAAMDTAAVMTDGELVACFDELHA